MTAQQAVKRDPQLCALILHAILSLHLWELWIMDKKISCAEKGLFMFMCSGRKTQCFVFFHIYLKIEITINRF